MRHAYLLSIVLLLCSCASTRAYRGAELPDDQLSTFKGFNTTCYGKLEIRNFDGAFSGSLLKAPAGGHRMTVRHWGEPFNSEDTGRPDPDMICIWGSEFDVSFNSRAGHIYSFQVQQSSADGTNISVWESDTPGGVDAHKIPSNLERTFYRRACAPTMEYAECLGFGRL